MINNGNSNNCNNSKYKLQNKLQIKLLWINEITGSMYFLVYNWNYNIC